LKLTAQLGSNLIAGGVSDYNLLLYLTYSCRKIDERQAMAVDLGSTQKKDIVLPVSLAIVLIYRNTNLY